MQILSLRRAGTGGRAATAGASAKTTRAARAGRVILEATALALAIAGVGRFSGTAAPVSDPPASLPGSWQTVANGDRVLALHRDGDDLWTGTEAGGLVRWTLSDGAYTQYLHPQSPLPDNTVYDVAPAVGGGVWAATGGGLVRFIPERGQWQVVTPETSPGMPARVVTAVAPLADGTLWVGFAQRWDPALRHPASTDGAVSGAFAPGGIARFDPAHNQWSSHSRAELATPPGDPGVDPVFRTLPSDNVTTLALDSEGTLWVGTRPYYAWDPSTCHDGDCLKSTAYWILTGGGLAAYRDGAWRRWYPTSATDTSCYDRSITALAADADRRMWVGTQGHGVLLMRGFEQSWACSSGQAYYVKPRGRPDPANPGLAGNVVLAVAVDPTTGRVWLSQGEGTDTSLGLVVLDPRGTFDDSPGSPSWFDSDDVYTRLDIGSGPNRDRRASALAVDADGPIVGTVDLRNGDGDGVWRAEPIDSGWRWRAYRTADRGLPSNQITAVADEPSGDVTWFATRNRGVARWQASTGRWTGWRAFADAGTPARIAAPAAAGSATVAVDLGDAAAFEAAFPDAVDLARFGGDDTIHHVMAFAPAGDGATGRLTVSPTLAADVAADADVTRLRRGPAGDRTSQLAVRGADDVWLAALRDDRLYQLTGSPPSCARYPDCWQDGGLSRVQGGAWQVFDPTNSPLPYREAVAVEVDAVGRVWTAVGNLVSTGVGLVVLDPSSGAWRAHTVTADFNAGNGVSDLAVDPATGDVWTAHYPVERRVPIGPGRPDQIVVAGGGVARWDGQRWRSWTKKDSGSTMQAFGDYGVYGAIAVDRGRGAVWAGGWSTIGSVFHWPRGENVHAQLDRCPLETCRARDWQGTRWLNDGLVSSLAVDAVGRLWVGTHRHGRGVVPSTGGVKLLDGERWTAVTPDDSPLPSNQVTTVRADGRRVWVGTLLHGAAVYAEDVAPPPTPTPFVPTAAPTLTPSATPTASTTPTASASPTVDGGPQNTPTAPSASPSPTGVDPGASATPTAEATPRPGASATATAATPPPAASPTGADRCGPGAPCRALLPTLLRYTRRR